MCNYEYLLSRSNERLAHPDQSKYLTTIYISKGTKGFISYQPIASISTHNTRHNNNNNRQMKSVFMSENSVWGILLNVMDCHQLKEHPNLPKHGCHSTYLSQYIPIYHRSQAPVAVVSDFSQENAIDILIYSLSYS